MSEEREPKYHEAPHTLDPNREIPEDAAPSAGHDEQQAERVREADEKFTEAVQEERERVAERGEVGPREVGDDAGEGDSGGDDVPDGTVQEVLDWVGDDQERAQRALDVERRGQNRSSLVSELEKR